MASNLEPPASSARALAVLARIARVAAALVVGVLAAAALLLETPWGVRTVARVALGAFNPWPGARAEVSGAAGGFLGGLELHGVRLSSDRGAPLASIDTVRVEYRALELIASGHRLRRAIVAGLSLDLTDWPALPPSAPPKLEKPAGTALIVDALELRRADVAWRMPPRGRDSLWWGRADELRARNLRIAGGVTARVDTVVGEFGPGQAPAQRFAVAASGDLGGDALRGLHLAIDGDSTHVIASGTCGVPTAPVPFAGTDLSVGFAPLAARDVRRYFPSSIDPGDVTLEARLRRDDSLLIAHVEGRGSRGARLDLNARVTPSVSGPVVLWARGESRAIDWGAWTGSPPGTLVIEGTLDADLRGPSRDRLEGSLDLALDGSRVGGHPLERARGSARFADGRAEVRLEARSEGYVLSTRGDAQPFAHPSTWNLASTLAIPPPDRSGAAPPPGARALFAGTMRSELRLRGRSLADFAGTVTVALQPEPALDPLLGEGRVDVTFDRGTARWRGGLDAAGGRLSASGRVVKGPDLGYEIDGGEIRGVDVAALLGDSTASRLDARLRLEGRGLSPATARVSAHLGGLALRYGAHRLDADPVELELRDGRARATAAARFDGAQLDLRAALASLGAPWRDAEAHLAFRTLDFAKLTGDTALASQLNGTVEARGQGSDLAALARAWGRTPAPAGTRASMELRLDPSSWRGHRVSALDVSSHLDGSDVALEGRMESTLGNLRFTGTVRPFSPTPSLRLDPATVQNLDVGGWLGRADLSTRLNGSVRLAADARDSSLALQAVLDGSSLNRSTFDRLSAHARIANGRLEGQVLASSSTDLVDARLEGTFPDRARPSEPMWLHGAGRVKIRDLGALLGRDSLEAGSDLTFDVQASQAPHRGPAGLSASGRVEGAGRFGETRIDSVVGAFTLAHGLLDVPRLEIRGRGTDVSGAGRVALPFADPRDSTSFALTGGLHDFRPLAPLLGAHTAAGSGTFSLRASGVPAATEITGDLHAARVARDEVWADSVALTFQGSLHDSALANLNARLHAFSLVRAGLPPRDVSATAHWDGTELAVEGRAVVDEGRSEEVAFRLAPGPEHTRLGLDRFEVIHGASRIALKQPCDVTFGRTGFRVGDLTLLQNGARALWLDGGIGADDRADLRLEIDSLEVTDYLDLFGITGLRGHVSLDAALTGTRQQPLVHGSWHGTITTQKRPATLAGTFDWKAGELEGNASFVPRGGQDLALTAHLPLDLTLAPAPGESPVAVRDRPMSWSLEARQLDLAWFAPMISPRVARDLKGQLNGRIEAGGVPSNPDYRGELVLSGARVQLPGLGTRYDSDRLALGLSGRDIRLEPGVIRSGKGQVEVQGRIALEGGRRTLDLQATPRRLAVINTDQITLQVSGHLGASGHLTAPRLDGALDVTSSTFYIEAGEGEHDVEKVVLTDQDVRDLDTRFSEATVNGYAQAGTPLDSLSLDVTAKVGSGVWVRRRSDPVLALEMAGDVRFRKQPAESLTATGRLEVKTGRSYLSFLGRRFDMTRAHIELPGPITDASAEIEARYGSQASQSASAPDVTALVTVSSTGTAIDLRSMPYMDRASLINYLTTGQTQGEMAQGTASGLAVGAALGAVGGAAGRSLGFQVVQVTQDAYGGQTLSAGNYVDPRIYLGFRQPVVQGRSTTGVTQSDTYTTEFEVELEVARQLLFNVQGGGTQYRFLLRPRLGK